MEKNAPHCLDLNAMTSHGWMDQDLPSATAPTLRQDAPIPPFRQLFEDAESIRELLRPFFTEAHRGEMRSPSLDAALPLRTVAFDEHHPLPCVWACPDRLPEPPFRVVLPGPVSVLLLEVVRIQQLDDETFASTLPPVVVRLGQRHEPRLEVTHSELHVQFGLHLAGVSEGPAGGEAQLIDLSSSGLGVRLRDPSRFPTLAPGQVLTNLSVHSRKPFADAPRAEVRHVERDLQRGELRCGLRMLFDEPSSQARWMRRIAPFVHPFTRSGHVWATSTWSLYEDSGYFHLSDKTPHAFSHLKSAFACASRRMDAAPELGSQISWPSIHGVEATMSLLRVYEGTSLVYQVARRRRQLDSALGRRMLREINLHAFDNARADPELRWMLVYVQDAGARFSRRAYLDYARRVSHRELTALVPFHAWEGDSSATPARLPPRLSIDDASADEREVLAHVIARDFPSPYMEALDLRPHSFDLAGVRSRWAARGLSRQRSVRILSWDGKPSAAGVFELAEEGLHLFGLLDVVRLYPLVGGGEAFFPYLLDDAASWFHTRGKSRFVYFAEEANRSRPLRPALRDLGGATEIIFSTSLLPDFLEHLHRVTAPAGQPVGMELH